MTRYAAVDACSHYRRMVPPVGLAVVVSAVLQIVVGG